LQTSAARLRTPDWIDAGKAAAGGPLTNGAGCIGRWSRLNYLVALMVVVTMYRFLGNGVACKSDRQSDRCGKAFDHENTLYHRGLLDRICAGARRDTMGRRPVSFGSAALPRIPVRTQFLD
jgi:hypothetical protein